MNDRVSVPAHRYQARRDALVETLRERELDGILITNPANRRYLTGFSGDDVPPVVLAVVFIGPRVNHLMTTATNTAWAAAESPGIEVLTWKRPWEPPVAEHVAKLHWKRVGFEEQALSFASHRDLIEHLPNGIELVPVANVVEPLRSIKDDDELSALRQAVAVTDEAFTLATRDLQVGVTERELAWWIERSIRELGADGLAFETIVAAGPHAARPHHTPSDHQIAEGEPVVIDMGARVAGYHGDLTRTIWLGAPSDRLRAVYQAVFQANEAARAEVRPGAKASDVNTAANDAMKAAGFGEYLNHGVGHGVGLRVHEIPSAGTESQDVLSPGQVMTIEPGVYIADWGGVRIEDIVAITDAGHELLTAAPKMTLTRA